MKTITSQDIDVLTAIIYNENIFSKRTTITAINNSCDCYNRVRYDENSIEDSLNNFIDLKIIKKFRNSSYKVKKNFRKKIKRSFSLNTDYFKISEQIKEILKSYQ